MNHTRTLVDDLRAPIELLTDRSVRQLTTEELMAARDRVAAAAEASVATRGRALRFALGVVAALRVVEDASTRVTLIELTRAAVAFGRVAAHPHLDEAVRLFDIELADRSLPAA